MKILAIEFSSHVRSVAVCEVDLAAVPLKRLGVAVEEGDRSSHAVSLVEEALQKGGMRRDEIDHFAVGLGPGSYTGIRAALAFLRGWQLGRSTAITGLGSTEILARQGFIEGLRGKWNIIVDAQRQEFYLAGYQLADAGPELVELLRIVNKAEIMERTGRGEKFLGPEADKYVPDGLKRHPSAQVLAELAARHGTFSGGEGLEPVYLRELEFVKAPPGGSF